MIQTKSYLEILELDNLFEFSKFIVEENYNHHLENKVSENYKEEINYIYKEEIDFYERSKIYVSKNYLGTILGTIRLLKWNFIDILPIQKLFGINPFLVINRSNINNIYHIGRFAIKKNNADINLFKKLMVYAITPICEHKENIAFAECDRKLLRVLNMLGIKTVVVGSPITYLGSETIPIMMDYDALISFYNKNKYLMYTSKSLTTPNTLPESVVYEYKTHNYSIV